MGLKRVSVNVGLVRKEDCCLPRHQLLNSALSKGPLAFQGPREPCFDMYCHPKPKCDTFTHLLLQMLVHC